MVQMIKQFKFWRCFQEEFLNRVPPKLRKAVKVLMAVVIGALVLAGLYALFGDTILPTLQDKIEEMFNYSD